jgi:tetratricopeptide (TPR) repeat protein
MTSTPSAFELALTGGPAPHRFTAFVPDASGDPIVQHTFDWRTDSTALALDLGALARAAISGHPPEDDLHRTFGRRLFDAVFADPIRDLWQERLDQLQPLRQPLRLVLRVDPTTARPLLNLPWEYLHDGRDFLALNWRTPISRLPWGLPATPLPILDEPLRVLVLVAAPLGLSQNQVLNDRKEEDLILAALGAARRAGHVDVSFAPNGALESLEAALREFDPHVLHFVGHGVFVSAKDTGYLLMETQDGHRREVANADFVDHVYRQARSLRFVFLSACQTAVAPRNDGFADLARRLLETGVPGVVAMQYSVLNRSAIEFGEAFYAGIDDGDPIDVALTEARCRLAQEGVNTVDFATPVLFLSDPACLRMDQAALHEPRTQAPLDLTGVARAQHFVGRGAELRELQTNLDPEQGRWRAAIVHGLGGMGKTVLAARLAERMLSQLDGVKALRVTPTTTAQEVLDQVGDFLLVGNARWNHPLIPQFVRLKNEPMGLEAKAAKLIEVLCSLRLLLILDNYEDVLPEGRAVSRVVSAPSPDGGGEARDETQAAFDPDLPKLVTLLVEGVPGPSRLLFTSRVDFGPVETGRLGGAIGHLPLAEMQFRDAVYLMETLPPLDRLPVAVIEEVRPGVLPAPAALSMRDLHKRLGGHPYTLCLFAEHARRSSVDGVLSDLDGIRQELLEFTLLDRAAAALPDRARELLRRAAIYDEPVPLEGLAFLVGDDEDAMPPVDREVQALVGWSLLTRAPGEETYAVPTPVREWARGRMDAGERLGLLRRAARFWLGVGRDSSSLTATLNARHYLFLAEDYEQAGDVVQFAFDYLLRWGQIELVLRLLNGSVRTLSGGSRAVALGNLATVYRGLGEYVAARRVSEQVLEEFQEVGDMLNVAATLHDLGNLYYLQGEYEPARQRYEQSLAIAEELGDRAGVARSLHQLGMLHQAHGEYGPARQRFEQALATFQELGDRADVAASLHQLGNLYYLQGEYEPARQRYEQSLAIAEELGDRASVARSLHQLGMLHQAHGEYGPARQRFEQALATFQELGDRADVAASLHQLGNLHYLQGEYGPARQRFEQALAIKQELGDRAGVARSLHGLGMLHQAQGEYGPARQRYEQSLAIAEELGDRTGVARSLHQLGTLHQLQGEYGPARQCFEQSLAIAEELGNRANAAGSLHQLGNLHYLQGEYSSAQQRYEQALVIDEELGDRAGVANSLHQLGNLHYLHGEYGPARQRYEQALAIDEELGDRAGLVSSLHQLGMLHQAQGEYGPARQCYEQSLAIAEELGDRTGVARSLHQLGMLHQAQGEYGPARQCFEQSLAIKEELGNRAGVAASLHQLGMILENEGAYGQAVRYAAHAFVILDQLGSPDRDIAGGTIARLQDKMGDEEFQAALREAQDAAPPSVADATSEQGLTLDQALQVVADNTVAVLTRVPHQRDAWWENLGQLQQQAQALDDLDFAALLGLLRRFVEGTDPTSLTSLVPPQFRQFWDDILRRTQA